MIGSRNLFFHANTDWNFNNNIFTRGLEGVIVTLGEFGHLYASYLGTDPSLFVAPQVDSRMGNFEVCSLLLLFIKRVCFGMIT